MNFHRLSIKNFKAIGECELDLERQGFVAIRGVNNTDPNTVNCGTGKSSISDALSFALCGETIKGGTDVKNQYTSGDCAVAVDFEKDGNEYQIIRVKGKSLQLLENGQDVSGKGIRDTQCLIEQKFPEFTPEFIGATIIFGQKMPNAFTANSASKRKEILERLTKSDFQIEEIKRRLTKKKDENAKALRIAEDDCLTCDVQLQELSAIKTETQQALDALTLPDDIEQSIEKRKQDRIKAQEQLTKLRESENELQEGLDLLQKEGSELGDKIRAYENLLSEQKENEIAEAQSKKETVLANARMKSDAALKEKRDNLAELKKQQAKAEIACSESRGKKRCAESDVANVERSLKQAEQELQVMEQSTVCPTCGKPWGDDAHKIDLEPYKKKTADARIAVRNATETLGIISVEVEKFENILKTIKQKVLDYEQYVSHEELYHREQIAATEKAEQDRIDLIRKKWIDNKEVVTMNEGLSSLRQAYFKQREALSQHKVFIIQEQNKIQELTNEVDEDERRVREYSTKVNELSERIKRQIEQRHAYEEAKLVANQKIDLHRTRSEQLNKLYNFATKKFRTILLEDTISIFEDKAKAIAQKYFGVNITFKQDGTNIEITYQGKQFENLSGGEECAAVLVIQTALRELLFDIMGEECNLLFIDECTDGADLELSEKIMALVGEGNTESVFIISHHSELNLPTDRTLVVEKNNNIAEVYWE